MTHVNVYLPDGRLLAKVGVIFDAAFRSGPIAEQLSQALGVCIRVRHSPGPPWFEAVQ